MFVITTPNGTYIVRLVDNKLLFIKMSDQTGIDGIIEAMVAYVTKHRFMPTSVVVNNEKFVKTANRYAKDGTPQKSKYAWGEYFERFSGIPLSFRPYNWALKGDVGHYALKTQQTTEKKEETPKKETKVDTRPTWDFVAISLISGVRDIYAEYSTPHEKVRIGFKANMMAKSVVAELREISPKGETKHYRKENGEWVEFPPNDPEFVEKLLRARAAQS